MDTGLNVRATIPTTYVPDRGAQVATSVAPATETELPTQKTVAAAGEGQQARASTDSRQSTLSGGAEATRVAVVRSVIFDEKAQELVYRNLDRSTGAVISQFPDEVTLGQRAYAREQFQQESRSQLDGVLA